MSSTRGQPFVTASADPVVLEWTAQLNTHYSTLRTTLPAAGVVVRPSPDTGLGLYVADGASFPHGAVLAAYLGHVTENPSSSLAAFALPAVLHHGRRHVLTIDAGPLLRRGDPLPTNAALANHQCEDPSTSAEWHRAPGHALPIMVLVSRRSLRRGTQLTYNYDDHLHRGAYTIPPEDAHLQPCFPCLCHPNGCPRGRFFPAL